MYDEGTKEEGVMRRKSICKEGQREAAGME
jgi:hypothetical protein